MNVRELMSTHVVTATPETSLIEVWNLIFKKHIHGLPIVDKTGKLVGIVTEADLLTKLFPDYEDILPDFSAGEELEEDLKLKFEKLKHKTAENFMNKRVIFTHENTNIMRALSRMIVRKVRQLPVVDDSDNIVGMISKGDIFDRVFKKNIKRLLGKK